MGMHLRVAQPLVVYGEGYCVTGMYHRTIDYADSAIHSQGHTPLLIVIQGLLIVIQEILRAGTFGSRTLLLQAAVMCI